MQNNYIGDEMNQLFQKTCILKLKYLFSDSFLILSHNYNFTPNIKHIEDLIDNKLTNLDYLKMIRQKCNVKSKLDFYIYLYQNSQFQFIKNIILEKQQLFFSQPLKKNPQFNQEPSQQIRFDFLSSENNQHFTTRYKHLLSPDLSIKNILQEFLVHYNQEIPKYIQRKQDNMFKCSVEFYFQGKNFRFEDNSCHKTKKQSEMKACQLAMNFFIMYREVKTQKFIRKKINNKFM